MTIAMDLFVGKTKLRHVFGILALIYSPFTVSFQIHSSSILLTTKSFQTADSRVHNFFLNRALKLQRTLYKPNTCSSVNAQFLNNETSFTGKHSPHLQVVQSTTSLADLDIVNDQMQQSPLSFQTTPSTATVNSTAVNTMTLTSSTVTRLDSKHIMNAILLIVCFAFVSYTVFNVDHGMTRGWTLEETAMRIPLDNWASYESSLNTQPVLTKTMINVIIYLLGDWASQTIFVKKNVVDFDALRTLRNGFIGLCFGPLVHQYYEFSDAILPVEVGINRLYKICMDQTIYLAVKCSIYIMAVNILSGETLDTGRTKVHDKLPGIMFTAWKFWPLVHLVTYNVIPARHRILWVNCVDLIWNAILSLRTNSDSKDAEKIAVDVDNDQMSHQDQSATTRK